MAATKYTNSPLVTYTKLSPNCNVRKNSTYNPSGAITKITLHHMACNGTLEAIGNGFANPSRQASSNYGIDSNGNIGMFVEEKNRAWTSGSASNDHVAITVEIANDGGAPDWHISDKALAAAIKLCVDICKRNKIAKLNYTGDVSGNLTMHCWFQATACPGPYLKSKFKYIADEVNKILNPPQPKPTPTPTPTKTIKVGDLVKIAPNAVYYNGVVIPDWVINDQWYVCAISGDRAVLGRNKSNTNNIQSAVSTKYLTVVDTSKPSVVLKAGDRVKMSPDAVVYGTNQKFASFVYYSILYVREVNGNRIVVSTIPTGAVTGAVDKKYLTKV